MKIVLAFIFISLTFIVILYGIVDLIIFTYRNNKELKSFQENNKPLQQESQEQSHHLLASYDLRKLSEIYRKRLNDFGYTFRNYKY